MCDSILLPFTCGALNDVLYWYLYHLKVLKVLRELSHIKSSKCFNRFVEKVDLSVRMNNTYFEVIFYLDIKIHSFIITQYAVISDVGSQEDKACYIKITA